VQPLVGVEHVREPEQIALIGAAPVVQDEQSGGISGGWAFHVRKGCHRFFR
jgi:hypothetical protein